MSIVQILKRDLQQMLDDDAAAYEMLAEAGAIWHARALIFIMWQTRAFTIYMLMLLWVTW